MKTAFRILLLLIVSGTVSFGQAPFLRSYGGTGSDYGKALVECTAGGYLIVGSTNSFYDVSTDIYVLRLTETGDYIWGRNLGAENQIEWGHDVKEASDGGFYICGISNNNASNNYDGILMKIDADGTELWTKTFGGPDWDFIENMAISSNDEILLAGQHSQNGNQEGWLIKTDSEGEILWEQSFEGTGMVTLTGVDVCENEDIVIVGYNDYTPLNTLTQISGVVHPDGNIEWVTAFPEMGNLITKNCVCSNENEILSTATLPGDDYDIIKYSAIEVENGSISWDKEILWESEGEAGGINTLENGNILLAASLIVGFNFEELDGVVFQFTPDGSYISSDFSEVFGGFGLDKLNSVIPTVDGGSTAVGQSDSFGNNNQIMLAHVNANGDDVEENEDFLDVATTLVEREQYQGIKIWPNPAATSLSIEIPSSASSLLAYHVVDVTGQVLKILTPNKKSGNVILNIATLQNGVYFLIAFESNGLRYQQKFVKVQ